MAKWFLNGQHILATTVLISKERTAAIGAMLAKCCENNTTLEWTWVRPALRWRHNLELVETVNLVQPTLKTSCHTSESSSRCSKEWIRRCSEEGVSMNPRDKGTEKPKQSPAHNGGTWFLFHFWRDNHESNNLWIEFAAISPVAQLFEKEFLATICWSTGRGRTTLVNECQVWVPPSPSPKSSCNEAEKHWTWWVRLPKRVLRCAQI